MPKEFKGLEIPPLGKNISEIQKAHCDGSIKCIPDCHKCLFDDSNLTEFTEWFNKKRYYGKE
jgi:hypothetical protein